MMKVYIKKGREQAIQRFHPWIFSGAIYRTDGNPQDGDIVEVVDNKENILGVGHYNNGSIAVRVLHFGAIELNQSFWNNAIQKAYDYRVNIGIVNHKDTNCYRLIHAEGDGLPGLIIDIYHQTAVIQCHSIGMHRQITLIKDAVLNVYGDGITCVFDKSKETLPENYASVNKFSFLLGDKEEETVKENGINFKVNWVTGQKTGFFLDQRDNRFLLKSYVEGKKVLNAFCYSGGFSMFALQAGAKLVHSVDVSAKAMLLTDENITLNNFQESNHDSITADVMSFLKENKNSYDVMVVDPPAYAKSLSKRHNAIQGYKRLNTLALEQIAPGGILFTFSCSQVVDRQLFYDTIVSAAIDAKRKVRVMRHLSQPADHPVSLFHPEGSYLKGLVLYVE